MVWESSKTSVGMVWKAKAANWFSGKALRLGIVDELVGDYSSSYNWCPDSICTHSHSRSCSTCESSFLAQGWYARHFTVAIQPFEPFEHLTALQVKTENSGQNFRSTFSDQKRFSPGLEGQGTKLSSDKLKQKPRSNFKANNFQSKLSVKAFGQNSGAQTLSYFYL